MLLHVAVRILSCREFILNPENINYAEALLETFVEQSHDIYGEDFMSYNVRNLQHLYLDVRSSVQWKTIAVFHSKIISEN